MATVYDQTQRMVLRERETKQTVFTRLLVYFSHSASLHISLQAFARVLHLFVSIPIFLSPLPAVTRPHRSMYVVGFNLRQSQDTLGHDLQKKSKKYE